MANNRSRITKIEFQDKEGVPWVTISEDDIFEKLYESPKKIDYLLKHSLFLQQFEPEGTVLRLQYDWPDVEKEVLKAVLNEDEIPCVIEERATNMYADKGTCYFKGHEFPRDYVKTVLAGLFANPNNEAEVELLYSTVTPYSKSMFNQNAKRRRQFLNSLGKEKRNARTMRNSLRGRLNRINAELSARASGKTARAFGDEFAAIGNLNSYRNRIQRNINKLSPVANQVNNPEKGLQNYTNQGYEPNTFGMTNENYALYSRKKAVGLLGGRRRRTARRKTRRHK